MPAAAALLLAVAGCVAAPGTGPDSTAGAAASVTELVSRLPAEAAGLRRGQALPLGRGQEGREVAYTSRGRPGAGATVEILGAEGAAAVPGGADSPAVSAALEELLAEALRPQPHRRVRERARFSLPETAAAGPAALRCAETEGSYGRERVQGLLCAGGFGGRLLRLRLAMPQRAMDREAPGTEPRDFAAAIATALRSGGGGATTARR
jgi:hypothetical protein